MARLQCKNMLLKLTITFPPPIKVHTRHPEKSADKIQVRSCEGETRRRPSLRGVSSASCAQKALQFGLRRGETDIRVGDISVHGSSENLEDIDAALAPTAEIAVPISEVLIYKKKKKGGQHDYSSKCRKRKSRGDGVKVRPTQVDLSEDPIALMVLTVALHERHVLGAKIAMPARHGVYASIRG